MDLGFYQKAKHAVRFWLLRRLPPCKETVELVSQSFERPLSLREQVNVKVHFWICAWCQWYMEHLQLLREVCRARADQAPELDSTGMPGLSFEARERIKRQLTGEK